MTRPLVIYHAECSDGFCAAWVANRHFQGEADFLPAQYGTPPPDVKDRDVYILDFSYRRTVMLSIIEDARAVVVLDHHRTAAAELAGDLSVIRYRDGHEPSVRSPRIVFDMGKSGGRLAWEHFFPGQPAPWLVDYTEDRDLWRWKLPNSREISAALASLPRDFTAWDLLHEASRLDILVAEGVAILRYQQQQVDSACKNAVEIDMDGHKVLTVNATALISEIAGQLAEGRPFGTSYFIRGDGKKVWSLRSREGGVDVSEVARKRGGGGHRQSAGFEEAVA